MLSSLLGLIPFGYKESMQMQAVLYLCLSPKLYYVIINYAWGQQRVCIDYTNLNKACPKDSFPILKIDQLVDSTAENELLYFMDAYFSYN